MGKAAGTLITIVILLCGFPILLLEFSPSAPNQKPAAPKTVSYKTNYYEVSGDSLDAIIAEMDKKGPTDAKGNRRYGALEWNISWSWPFLSSSKPDYSKTIISPDVVMTLPRLTNREGVPADLLSKWDSYTAKMIEHEKKHLKNASETIHRIEARIRDLPDSLHYSDANRIIKEEIIRGRRQDLQYDRHTNHGRTEGIFLE